MAMCAIFHGALKPHEVFSYDDFPTSDTPTTDLRPGTLQNVYSRHRDPNRKMSNSNLEKNGQNVLTIRDGICAIEGAKDTLIRLTWNRLKMQTASSSRSISLFHVPSNRQKRLIKFDDTSSSTIILSLIYLPTASMPPQPLGLLHLSSKCLFPDPMA